MTKSFALHFSGQPLKTNTSIHSSVWLVHQNMQGQKEMKAFINQKCADLKQPYYSLSHSLQLSGFVTSTHPCGFDIEKVSRISEKIIARISHAEDQFDKTCSIEQKYFLWSAKEAAFKAFGNYVQRQVDLMPATLSQLSCQVLQCSADKVLYVSSWQGSQKEVIQGCGQVALFADHSIASFFIV